MPLPSQPVVSSACPGKPTTHSWRDDTVYNEYFSAVKLPVPSKGLDCDFNSFPLSPPTLLDIIHSESTAVPSVGEILSGGFTGDLFPILSHRKIV